MFEGQLEHDQQSLIYYIMKQDSTGKVESSATINKKII